MNFDNSRAPISPKMGNEVHPLMGSGYDAGFKAGQKQARAEVLAACLAALPTKWPTHGLGGMEMSEEEGDLIDLAYKRIKELQPAAKDLEALLREERVLGEIQAAEDIHETFKHLIHPPLASTQACWVCEYINVRKEKARAILEGKE